MLFVDLVKSTEMVASLDAEAAMRRLQPVLQTMREAVERFGGTVMRTLGDGIMALFGAPWALEGHAVLACQSALAIRDAIGLHEERLAVREGLHSGEVVADTLLIGPMTDAGTFGMTLHLGSRLPAQVEPGEICISEDCYQLVRGFCNVRALGQRTLRGVPAPVALYSLLGMKRAAAWRQFPDVTLTSFVGRDKEMSALKHALRAAEAGAADIIGIVGAPGAGKSRLCHEFAEFCRWRLTPVFEVRAQPYGAATPLQPVLELLRLAYFNITPNEQPMTAAAKVDARLAEIDAPAEGDLPLVCDFLGISSRHEAPTWLGPKARMARLLEILQCLVRLRGAELSVVIIEDLHWLDEASEAFVAALAQAVIGTRTLLIVNCRTGYGKPWMRASRYHQIALAELDHRDTNMLVDELIGSNAELTEVRRLVAERSGGNPFFAEELVRSLIDRGVVLGRRGAFRRGANAVAAALPANVQAVIGARIDILPPADRELLQIGAIIGKEFQTNVLASVAGLQPSVLEATLGRLCAADLLRRCHGSDGREYGFRHPLIQEVAYATQLRLRRGPLHAAVARAMERIHRDRGDEFAALIAYHLEEAGELNRAAFHAARAARWIGQTSAASAMKQWRKVRALIADQPRSRENDALRIQASGQIAWLGWREGLTAAQAKPFVREALAWASEIDDSMIPLLLLVDGRIAQVSGGKSDVFVRQLWRAIAMAEAKGDEGRLATLHASLSHAYGWAGLLRQALAASDAALARLAAVSDFDHQFLGYSVEHWTISLRGRILLRLGRFDEARQCLDQIIGINVLSDPTVLFMPHIGYLDLAWCLDDAAMASVHAGRVAALAERHGSSYLKLYRMASRAIADGIAGAYGQAIQGAKDSLEFLRQTGAAIEYEPELLASLADYLMRSGDLAQAVAAAKEAVTLGRARDARLPECRAKITLASLAVMMRGGDGRAAAERLIGDAERLIAESGAMIYRKRLDEARGLSGATITRRDGGAQAA